VGAGVNESVPIVIEHGKEQAAFSVERIAAL
jgi:hypothetical protein